MPFEVRGKNVYGEMASKILNLLPFFKFTHDDQGCRS